MKQLLTFLLVALIGWSCSSNPNRSGAPQVVDLSTLGEHPRLILPKGAEVELQKRIDSSDFWKGVHADLMAEADVIVTTPLTERKQIGRRLLQVSRENLRRIFFLSYAYRMSGEERFLKRAEAEMLNVAAFTDWNPRHFLDVGEMTMAMAIGYDWLYDELSEESRATIRQAIIDKGLLPSYSQEPTNEVGENRPVTWWIDCNHNWNQVCHGGMSFGAIAVADYEPALAQDMLDRAIEKLPIAMAEYAPNGCYPEGVGYWAYGTQFNALLLAGLESAFGTDFGLKSLPGFMQTGEFAAQLISPTGKAFNYMDNHTTVHVSSSPFWFYAQTGDPSLTYQQVERIKSDTTKSLKKYRALPALIAWGASAETASPAAPEATTYLGEGLSPVAAMRSEWNNAEASFLGVKLGTPSANHGHMDAGSFVFESEGVRWAIDLGPENYTDIEAYNVELWNMGEASQRWDLFRYNNHSHNTLTFNGKNQKTAGYAALDSTSTEAAHRFVVSDLTSLYAPWMVGVERAFSLVDGNYAVIEDQVTTEQFYTRMRWTMATEANVEQLSDKLLLLTQDGKKLYLKVESELPITWSLDATPTEYPYNTPNPTVTMIGFDADLPTKATSDFKVFLMPASELDTDGFQALL